MNQFTLKKTLGNRFVIYHNQESIGLLVCQNSNESPRNFSESYGTIFPRNSFVNIEVFAEIPEVEYYSIEYLSQQELQALEIVNDHRNRLFTIDPIGQSFYIADYYTQEELGVLLPSDPNENYNSFSQKVETVYLRQQILKIDLYPRLKNIPYFSITENITLSQILDQDSPETPSISPENNPVSALEISSMLEESIPPAPPMNEDKTYLELSQDDGSSHKFYEVIVTGTEVKVRYGRIGDPGQTQNKTYPTPEKAKAEAEKKIKEKMKKGYEPAVMGVRQKRSITRREVTSNVSTAKTSPLLWRFKSGSSAFGIFVDRQACWVGNQQGKVFKLDHQGEVINQFQLPEGVKCIVGDDQWVYAGCDDGNVYDLSGKLPRLAYEIDQDVDIYWLDIHDGILAVADNKGAVVKINPESESQWTRLSQGQSGWMVRIDSQGIYHGHSSGVTMYSLEEGKNLWHNPTKGSVLFGWQETNFVYAGTSDKKVYQFSKTGEAGKIYQCDATIYSCATSPDGKFVFAGDNSSSIYCFNEQGERLWKFSTGCGSALSMQYDKDCVYIVTTDGSLACISATETDIQSAQEGNLPKAKTIQAPKTEGVQVSTELEITRDTENGVIVQCVKEGSKLRVKVISSGYNSDWMVQFPRNIREEGVKYLVQEIKEASQGGFYRAYGEIKRIIE